MWSVLCTDTAKNQSIFRFKKRNRTTFNTDIAQRFIMQEYRVNLGKCLSLISLIKPLRYFVVYLLFRLLIFFTFPTYGSGNDFCFDESKEGKLLWTIITYDYLL